MLDSRFRIPGLGIRFGWDSVLGLVPGLGDLATAVPSGYMIYQGAKMGARRRVLAQMGANAAVDFVIGGVPVLGDVFDVFFKAHRRNIALLKREMARVDAADQGQGAAAGSDGSAVDD